MIVQEMYFGARQGDRGIQGEAGGYVLHLTVVTVGTDLRTLHWDTAAPDKQYLFVAIF